MSQLASVFHGIPPNYSSRSMRSTWVYGYFGTRGREVWQSTFLQEYFSYMDVMLERSTWCWENRVERTGIRSACGIWEVKTTNMQAGYCIKLQTLCCRKQKGKRPSENLWDKTHSKSELVGKLWERRTVISLSDWLGDVKSNGIYTAICSILIVCESGVYLITCDSADCQLSSSSVTINVWKYLFLQAFLSCPNLYYVSLPSCVLHTPPIYSVHTHMSKIQQIQFYEITPQFMSCL